MTSTSTGIGLTLLLAGFAPAAQAQSYMELSVTGRVLLDIDSTLFHSTVVGPAGGVAVELGGRRFGVQVAFDWPASHEVDQTSNYVDPKLGQTHQTLHRSGKSTSWTAMVSMHPGSGSRAQASVLAGMVGATHRYGLTELVVERSGPDGGVVSRSVTGIPQADYFWPGVAFGTDIAIHFTSHLSLVPEARFFYFPFTEGPGWIFRAGGGLRWTF